MKTARPWWRRILGSIFGEPTTGANIPAQPVQRTTAPKPTKTGPYVFVTKSGKKFHYDQDCQALQSAWARNEVFKIGLTKAKASGRSACSRCCWDYLRD